MTPTGLASRSTSLIALLLLAAVFGPALLGHFRNSQNPNLLNDDARQQIFPFYRYTDDGPASPDLLGDYQLALMPLGFRALYRSLAPIIDPQSLSKLLPYPLLLLTLLGAAMASRRLAGEVAGWTTVALILQAPIFLERMTGGMPKAFAFPLLGVGMWMLIEGRVRALGTLTVVAAAFYSVPAVLLGITLAVLLLIVPSAQRGDARNWGLSRRCGFLALIAILSAAVLLPVGLQARQWGRMLGSGDAAMYPEAGPGGRYADADLMTTDRASLPALFIDAYETAQTALGVRYGPGEPSAARDRLLIAQCLLIATGVGALLLAVRRKPQPEGRRLVTLGVATLVAFLLASLLKPYLYVPARFITYGLPLFVVVILPAVGVMAASLLLRRTDENTAGIIGALVIGTVALLAQGGRGDALNGLWVDLTGEAELHTFLRGLPNDALIAGWPRGAIDNVPYAARRRAFVTEENHMAFQEGYVLEMRRRVRLLMAALFDTDTSSLVRLRDSAGVTHLIVEQEMLRSPPSYFAPFNDAIEPLWLVATSQGLAVTKLPPRATVFDDGHRTVIDLSKL